MSILMGCSSFEHPILWWSLGWGFLGTDPYGMLQP